jgi:hypothetical protein
MSSFFSFFFSFFFFFLFFFLSFFLFKNYLQNEKSFVKKKHFREIIFQSPVVPITYRVITMAPLGDGTFPVKCQESWFLTS